MIITEIGFNHLGKVELANSYVNTLLQSGTDAITFQIREKQHRESKPQRYLPDDTFSGIFSKVKNSGKKVGIAIADIEYISFFENLDVDFYKVIRNDITNMELLRKLSETNKVIYVSTGMASEEEILNFIKQDFVQSGNFRLVHTQLSYSLEDCNLQSIQSMKKHGIPVAYGSHCRDEVSIFMSLCFSPSDVLFYVKGEEDIEYPDHEHAIRINSVKRIIDKIKKARLSIGSGKKEKMINKIEVKR
tara:strand:- start:1110 stop:1847 length:738 start_codon:yes stop_codon:yes gene_type:complete